MSSKGPQLNDTYIILVFNCPSQFYSKYCSENDNELKKLKGLNLFSGLIELDYIHLATGLNEEIPLEEEFNEIKQTEDIKKKFETTVKFKSLLRELFEHFDAIAEELIDTILEKHCNIGRQSKLHIGV